MAYDLTGDQTTVLRGALGLYFDRPDGNVAFGTVANPPTATGLTQQWGSLADISNSQVAAGPVPQIVVNKYDSAMPKDFQWNIGVQRQLPWASAIDVAYVGHHAFDVLAGQQNGNPVNINTIDLGTFLPGGPGIDPTQTGNTALNANLVRPFRGYGNINIQWPRWYRTYHSLQSSFNRRFQNGFQFGVSYTWSISDKGNVGMPSGDGNQGMQLRINHNSDGSWYDPRGSGDCREAVRGPAHDQAHHRDQLRLRPARRESAGQDDACDRGACSTTGRSQVSRC